MRRWAASRLALPCPSNYFLFGCSAMSKCVESGMLRDRPFGGVMTLIHKSLRRLVETIYCEDRITVVRVANYLIF